MESYEDYQLMVRFFENKMSPEEKRLFDERVAKDKAFAKEVAFYMTSNKVARKVATNERLEKFRKENRNELIRRRLIIGIGIILSILILFFILNYFGGSKNLPFNLNERDKIFADWKTNESSNLNVTGSAPWKGKIFIGDYPGAIKDLSAILSEIDEPCKDLEVRYYLGVLKLYQQQDFKQSIDLLECALEAEDNALYREDAPFHLIIAYVGIGDIGQAKGINSTYKIPLSSFPKHTQSLLQ